MRKGRSDLRGFTLSAQHWSTIQTDLFSLRRPQSDNLGYIKARLRQKASRIKRRKDWKDVSRSCMIMVRYGDNLAQKCKRGAPWRDTLFVALRRVRTDTPLAYGPCSKQASKWHKC